MKKILLADDEEHLRILIETTLESPECQVIHACDGPAALDLAIRERPDLIILDWMMPAMNGLEVLQAIREHAPTRRIPIVMLTARGQDKDRALALALGVTSYLAKPFSPLELLERVQEALAQSTTDQEGGIGKHSFHKQIARSA
jgi:DNA-binding response OmpR family regulator